MHSPLHVPHLSRGREGGQGLRMLITALPLSRPFWQTHGVNVLHHNHSLVRNLALQLPQVFVPLHGAQIQAVDVVVHVVGNCCNEAGFAGAGGTKQEDAHLVRSACLAVVLSICFEAVQAGVHPVLKSPIQG